MLEIKNVYKTYSSKNGVTHRALENVSLKFEDKGLVFILGKSGSGKSTLLNLIGGIDNFDRGDIIFNNKSFLSFKEKDYDHYRNSCIGFVFQDFNLLDNLTAYENVALALDLQSKKNDKKIIEMLKQMEVDSVKNRMIRDLSGGQKQRVAIARALIKNPKIILADEPTGSLDSETSDAIIKILLQLAKDRLVIVVTHNKELAYENGDRIIEIRDGFVLKDLMRKQVTHVNDKNTPTLVSSSLVVVPKNTSINDEAINDLNVTISEKRQDYYLLIEQNKNRVMSLYPNVSEVIKDENKKETFIPYHYSEHDLNDNNEDIKTNLPLKKAIKFSFSTLKKRKLKLFFTIILAILSVILTGTAINFTQFSLTGAIASSLSHANKSYIEVASSFAISDPNYTLQENDLNFLNDLNTPISYEYNQNLTYSYSAGSSEIVSYVNSAMNNYPFFKDRNFYGYLSCDDITKFTINNQPLKIIYEKEDLTQEDYTSGVMISSLVAHAILEGVSYDSTNANHIYSMSDLINKNISIQSKVFGTTSYHIIGIYDIDEHDGLYQRYLPILDNTADITLKYEYEELAKNILTRLVVYPQFMNNIAENREYVASPYSTVSTNGILITSSGEPSNSRIYSIAQYHPLSVCYINPDWKGPISKYSTTLKENQIFVGIDLFKKYVHEQTLYLDNKPESIEKIRNLAQRFNGYSRTLTINNGNGSSNEVFQSIQNVEIVGIFDGAFPGQKNGIIVANDIYQELIGSYIRPNKALININKFKDLKPLINSVYDNSFIVENRFVSYFNDFASVMEKFSTLINIGVFIWFIFVTILLYSFMSNTIKDSSKQIGILKALGANIKDIYKIYMIEAVIIGIFASIFGICGYYFGGLLANKIITDLLYTFYYPLFTCNFLIIFIMLFSTFAILFISLIIPMSKVKNIKPIDVINNAN